MQDSGLGRASIRVPTCRRDGVVRFMIAIDNFDHISLAFGAGAAQRATCRVRTMIRGWLGDRVDIHAECGGIFYGTLQIPPAGDGAVDLRNARDVANRVLTNPPAVSLALDHGEIWLSVSAAWALREGTEPAAGASPAPAMFGQEGRAPFFGQLPGRGENWVARYRADMAAAAALFASFPRSEPPAGLPGDGSERSLAGAVSRTPAQFGRRQVSDRPMDTASPPLAEDLVYAWQPVRDAEHGEDVLFYEMCPQLVSRDGARRGLAEVRPALERLGLVRVLDRHLVLHALNLLEGDPDLAVSVQISPQSASDCARWGDVLRRITGDRAVAQRLTVAITETASFPDFAGAVQFVSRLQALGCVIAIDNFGMGYTSIRELLALCPDIVSIAPFFVRYGSGTVPEGAALGHLAGLAGMMASSVIVKGVANARQSRLALDVGVRWQQGDFLGAPGLGRPARGGVPCKQVSRPRRRPQAA